jgi:undecaprenyl-phosphate galactose phosphotransferase
MVSTNELLLILKANFIVLVAIFFIVAIAKLGHTTSRAIVIEYFILNNLNVFWAYLLRKNAFTYFPFLKQSIFAVCDKQGYKNIHSWFGKGNPFGYELSEIVMVEESTPEVLHVKIESLIHEEKFDSVVIDIKHSNILNEMELVDTIQRYLRRVIILPKMSRLSLVNAELISSVHHKGMAFYLNNSLLSPVERSVKMGFDFVLSLMIIVCTFPFLVWIYGVVYIATKGHPIFTHKRIGRHGKVFNVYKFRTMHLDAHTRLKELLSTSTESGEEWGENFKLKNDPRVTKIGNFLRKTSLDELPQLINVLKGEMSLVGPRPIIHKEIEKYGEYFEYFTAVKPGITGLWQVSGRNDVTYDERVQLDVWYVRNWSIELDIQILMKTILVVLGRKGSY